MGVLRWMKGRRKTTASIAIVSAATIALGVLAFTYEGFTQTDVDLHDGGVWVTRTSTSEVGHLNVQAQELDGHVYAPSGSTSFDVLQDGANVFLRDGDGTLLQIDPATMTLGATVPLAADVDVQQRGGTAAILSPDGELWAMPVAEMDAFDPEDLDPIAEVGADAALSVSLDGSVAIASPEQGAVLVWEPSDEGGFDEPSTQGREGLEGADDVSLTFVGDEAVALAGERLFLPGRTVDVPEGAVLQQVGDAAATVVLATSDLLLRQPLGVGELVQQSIGAEGGEVVAPVQLGGCLYAAYPSSGQFVRACQDASRNAEEAIEGLEGAAVFRVNRGMVVLNQFESGQSWLVTDQVVLVDNWDDLVPPPSDEESEEQDESLEDILQQTTPPPTEENHAPVATDDQLGARPGRATILPVLANDSDQDGDVLTARVTSDLPSGVTVSPIANDSQLQIQIPASFSERTITFQYEVDDGRDGTDSATVTVTVRTPEENSPPEPLFDQSFQIEQTARFEYPGLQGWYDPDGDDFYLQSATSPSGDQIESNPSGRILYTATGSPGPTSVDIVVADSRGDTATGSIGVIVMERNTAPITANADFVSVTVGQEVSIEPLANDYVPGTQDARLAQVSWEQAPQITGDHDDETGIATLSSDTPGTYYLPYLVSAGAASASSRIRVDVREADDEARPVAVRDIALLPQSGETLVDLLANDVDPSGGVLVVQSVTVNGVPVTAQLLERRVLRLIDAQGLTSEATISYTVSNGRFTETGQVVIIPVAPPSQPTPPTAVADTATVREGDFVSIPVLDNDFSPDELELTVTSELVETTFAGGTDGCDATGEDVEGCAFVDGDEVRVFVPVGGPSSVRVVYEITDEFGNRASAPIDVTVIARDAGNDPPIAQTVEARVVEGNRVSIPIPLDGIDPDGDGVELVGYDEAPDAGRVTEVGDGFFVYEAYEGTAGTTSFTYRVRDRWGIEATAAVVIGIAPPPDINQVPFAETDAVSVQPGRAVAVPVLANDSDPDGDTLTLQVDGIEGASEELGDVTIDEDRNTVDFTAPEAPGEYELRYTIDDGRGGEAQGVVLITVAEDAPLEAPVAVDDVVPAADVVAGEPISVPVLDNDLDPDGSPDALEVTVLQGPGDVVTDGIRVTPSDEEFQVVTYRVTDPDGETAEAFVFVPIARDPAPRLTSDAVVEVQSGISYEFELSEYVTVSQNSPRITTADRVQATNENEDPLVLDVDTLQYTSELGYTGPATLSFEVTDGTSETDPNGTTAVLSIALLVRPSSAVAPTFSGAAISVPQNGQVDFDLTTATRDPDVGDLESMEYELVGGQSDQIDAELSGQVISLSAPVDANVGTSVSYSIEVIDRHGNREPGTVVATVVISNEPLAIVRDDAGEAVQGIASNVNVLANDWNPFEGQAPLVVTNAVVVGGQGQASTDGSTVTVTPGGDFSGVLTVQYTVRDATDTAQRERTGQIVLNVKGRPEAPIRPNVLSVGDQTVTLAWAAPAANGAAIQDYTVQSADGSFTQLCTSTTCTLQGLVNDQTYQFQVVARNEVGSSDPSPTSSDARPDVRPDPPAAPRAERGDTQLSVTWQTPGNRGSAITQYLLEISPPPASGQPTVIVPGGATSYVWQGLTNGTAYSFRVQAYNDAPEPSEWSPAGAAVTPAGPPFQVTGVAAERDQSIPGNVQVHVTWSQHETQSNGAAITNYLVQPYSNGAAYGDPLSVTGATTTRATFGAGSLPAGAGATLTFTVQAVNDVGPSQASAQSNGVRDATTPGAPTITGVSDGDGWADITMQPGPTNGARAEEVAYQVFVNGTQRGTVSATGGRVTVANQNAPGANVTVRAVSTVQGITYAGPPSNAVQAAPYGPIQAPSANATAGTNTVNVSWGAPAANGRPVSVQININGGGWENVANTGSRSVPTNAGTETRIQVRASTGQAEGVHGTQTTQTSAAATARANPSVRLTRGDSAAGPEGCNAPCYYFQINWENLSPGDYTFQCHHTESASGSEFATPGTISVGSGNGSTQYRKSGSRLCYNGYPGDAWFTLTGGPDNVNLTSPRVSWP
ncbi:fibronectin type III domain-containing protein [Agrococcus jejuensis]|uniref:Fibronectin type III domain-containing protein n=1 Tax=Agrococcus jejuensis TaxID=399736 RepID=A0A1G8BUP1_9MICO|nr:Ig-like domain-containing protein [Agrococcus jejuensis]SDH36882.1 Fibronectin type III domain-containing protein [Agrococcus jejuensis]